MNEQTWRLTEITGIFVDLRDAIDRLSRVFVHLVDDVPPEGPAAEDLVDLRRVLYGLHAVIDQYIAYTEEKAENDG